MSIPGITSKGQQNQHVLRSLALEEIQKRYPASKWVHAYTDGSAMKAIKNGGSGAYIQLPKRRPVSLSAPSSALSSNYRAEISALVLAADHLNSESVKHPTVFLTDSLSALQSLDSMESNQALTELREKLNILSKTTTVVMQWLPAHCGINGNEKADQLAKEASQQEQPTNILQFQEAKTLIKYRWNQKFNIKNSGYKPQQDPFHLLSRPEQTTIFRLRTGHCRLRAHLKKIGLAESAACECRAGDQTPEHILQTCPSLNQQRARTWPTPTNIREKLWGSVHDLKLTTQYMAASGVWV